MAGIKSRKGQISINMTKTHNGQPVRLTKYYKARGGAIMCPLNPETGEMFFDHDCNVQRRRLHECH